MGHGDRGVHLKVHQQEDSVRDPHSFHIAIGNLELNDVTLTMVQALRQISHPHPSHDLIAQLLLLHMRRGIEGDTFDMKTRISFKSQFDKTD